MKPSVFSLFRPLSVTAVVTTVFALHSEVKAQSTWNTNTSGNWGTAANWTGGVPNAAGATANATFNVTATRTITLDGVNGTHRTIGTLTIGDLTTRSNAFVISSAAGTTNSLIFDSGGAGNAALTTTTLSVSDTINAPIILNSSLDINNASTEGTTARTLTLNGAITSGNASAKVITVTGASAFANVRIAGNIIEGAGPTSLVKNGTNILTLAGAANSYTGGISLTQGSLFLNSATAAGTGALTITGGTLGSTVATALSSNNAQNWNGNFNFGGTTDLNLGTGAVTMSASRQIGLTGTTTAGVGPMITVGGDIGGGAFSLTTINSGSSSGVTTILNLDGTNTYTGGTNVNGGVVRFADAAAVPVTGNITVGVNGSLSVSGVHTTLAGWLGNSKLVTTSTGALALTGNSSEAYNPIGFNGLSLGAQVGSTVVYTGAITASAAGYFVGGGGGSIEFSNLNAFTGGSGITVGNGGSGTTILSNSNDYTGTTTVRAGTVLNLRNNGALGGTTLGTSVNAGGGIQLQDNVTITGEALTLNGTGAGVAANNIPNGLATINGNNEWAGNITATTTGGNNVRFGAVGGNLLVSGNVAIGGSAALVLTGDGGTGEISGVVSGTGSTNPIIKNGDSVWTLSGTNTFTGLVRLDDGVLIASSIGSAAAAGNLGQTDNVIGFGETTATGTLRYIGTGEVSARGISLRSTSTSNAGGGVIEQAGTGVLEFSGNVSSATTTVKTITLTGSTAGTGKLSGVIGTTNAAINVVKNGSNTWEISNTGNLYTGATTVNAGTLTVTGNINSSTALNVTGGTFAWGASDIVTGPVNLSGGLLQTNDFSDSLGVLTLTGASQISMAGAAGSIVAFGNSSSATWTAGGLLSILNWTGSVSGGGSDQILFDSVTPGQGITASQLSKIVFVDPNGNAGTYSAVFVGNEIVPGDLIPEPSVMLLGALGGLGMVIRRRRSTADPS